MSGPVFIAVPCHGGVIGWRTCQALMGIQKCFSEQRIQHTVHFSPNTSLVMKIRNLCANITLYAKDQNGPIFDSLFFLDADCSFNPEAAVQMVHLDKPIVALPFTRRLVDWDNVAKAAKAGFPSEALSQFGGTPIFENDGKPFQLTEPIKASVGCGAMLIQRSVFQALADKHPEWSYRPVEHEKDYRDALMPDTAINFFQAGVDPETQTYISEDLFFVKEARKLGLETYVLPWVHTVHSGQFDFHLNFHAMAQLSNQAKEAA